MKPLMIVPLLLVAACSTPQPICDREAQEWDKFGTQQDECEAPAAVPLFGTHSGYVPPSNSVDTPTRTSSTPVEYTPEPPEVVEKPRKPIHHAYRSAVRERREALTQEKELREARNNAERGVERDEAQAHLNYAVSRRRLAQENEQTTRNALDDYDQDNRPLRQKLLN